MTGIEWLANNIGRRDLNEFDLKIIVALADCRMNVSEAARQLYAHRNTVAYHIRRIKKITGKDPLNFYDLCDLMKAVRR